MAIKRGLGRGLDALIPSNTRDGKRVSQISISSIRLNPRQPRSTIDTEELAELAESIRKHGILQPIIVTHSENSGEYTLIAGQRRLQAASIIEMHTIPAIIRDTTTDVEMLEIALIENIQRSNLNSLESAQAYNSLVEDFGMSHDEISKRVGKSRTTISNTIRLLKLSPAVQTALSKGYITEGHARAILSLTNSEDQADALSRITTQGLNVRQTESIVKVMGISTTTTTTTNNVKRSRDEIDLEDRLRNSIGTKINLKRNFNGSGKLIIYFYSDEELDSLTNRLIDS
jgi:ParB family chromosome partitioning protein